MRFAAISVPAALMALTLSTALTAQRPDDQIDPRSMTLLQEGRSAQAAGNLDGAVDAFETALAVDPRNRQAYILLAEVSRKRGLPGKAIRFYSEALVLEPNDLAALRGQGEAMMEKGAVEKAKENLAKIKTICRTQCKDAAVLAAVIAKGPPAVAAAPAGPAAVAAQLGTPAAPESAPAKDPKP
ncbi:tetratricopeptide repeat protein [Sphingomonas canadensis]|uniref:Tetratricopeptide repeat protein n=1 Tax=Sphingomonas canadensis TaxID=1219257 RepID=A0ABW3HBW6_9SPHN|nr:tetratricopeptide repeat protein [Sphingomonas canadensis]MCW3836745.1 tetratricopeptide repeat protein [Sphingomonas canadensis]